MADARSAATGAPPQLHPRDRGPATESEGAQGYVFCRVVEGLGVFWSGTSVGGADRDVEQAVFASSGWAGALRMPVVRRAGGCGQSAGCGFGGLRRRVVRGGVEALWGRLLPRFDTAPTRLVESNSCLEQVMFGNQTSRRTFLWGALVSHSGI